MTNSKQWPTIGCGSVTAEQAGEQMSMLVRYDTEKGASRRCCQKHTGIPQNSASLPKPAQKDAMEIGKEKQREKRPESVRSTSSSLRTRDLFFFLVLLLL